MKARSKSNQLQLYHGNWATLEIMKTFIKNKRSYQKRLGSANQADDDMTDGDHNDEAISTSDDEGIIDEKGEGGDIDDIDGDMENGGNAYGHDDVGGDIDGDIDEGGNGGNVYVDEARDMYVGEERN